MSFTFLKPTLRFLSVFLRPSKAQENGSLKRSLFLAFFTWRHCVWNVVNAGREQVAFTRFSGICPLKTDNSQRSGDVFWLLHSSALSGRVVGASPHSSNGNAGFAMMAQKGRASDWPCQVFRRLPHGPWERHRTCLPATAPRGSSWFLGTF